MELKMVALYLNPAGCLHVLFPGAINWLPGNAFSEMGVSELLKGKGNRIGQREKLH